MTPLWEKYSTVVCMGTGGVGKTTAAASLAAAAAAAGKKTLVMTIDPSRRLAQALGVSDTVGTEVEIDPKLMAQHGLILRAPLWTTVPNMKRIFDDFV